MGPADAVAVGLVAAQSQVLRSDQVNVRALDVIHVASAEILVAEAHGDALEFWTHDGRQATAALSRGLTVCGA